ncbi:unnamed protein product [Acanthoscelides obtectus]|uniref:BESS domain-containing protein n=1 Tax=Acanthoscelides obtectus TaxID=200917 RepID=A0A9P0MJR9_ACAOB|nr:unnamed protein product [Acanthoscelides obtectus]CAK1680801.1 hypothetical protein AOBTE_LOCUS32885 [Acanthoscelides obtectus]
MIEQDKLKEFKRKSEVCNQAKIQEDADYHFLMSLLPYLRKVPEERKLDVGTKLQQVFCDEQKLAQQRPYGNDLNSDSQHQSTFNRHSSAEFPHHPIVNYDGSPQFTNLSAPTSGQTGSMENYHSSSESTIPSGPSSEESAIHQQYGDIAPYFSQINPQK